VQKEIAVEQVSGEASYERATATDLPVSRPADQPLQFEFSADDKHKWEGGSDDRIKLAVMTALHWDLAVPRDRVLVRVERGWVTLTGEVSREYERSRAEADARTTRGVSGVTNEINCKRTLGQR
jgi:osmotically-inducible protein OsmY